MAYLHMPSLRFVLYDVLGVTGLFEAPRFQEFNQETIDILLESVKDLADRECFPCFREMDEKPAYFDPAKQKVMVHPQVGVIMEKAGEMGLISAPFDHDHGGMQLPAVVFQSLYFIMEAANNNLIGYPGLTSGAAELILSFASEELKHAYAEKMLQGKWSGTMCLTEPQAGSSLSDITTSATPTSEGYYKIKGQKIFISGGDQQFSENIVHLLLARIDGAPAGVKGISLFVVPRERITATGLEQNDVVTGGDFQKMGQRGYSTVQLFFGEKDDCRGWLVGEPHQGLKYMFQMMNGARIAVGRGGVSISTAAYYASLQYAQERPQGRRLSNGGAKDLSQGQTLIINHPDVRRMLLVQKAIAEGSLAIVLLASYYQDWLAVATTPEEKEKYDLLLEILTPIAKAYPTERGQQSVSAGLQVLGGMGFCTDTVLQQYYRDIRIMPIYEGTTGIQSLDLLGRKVTMENGKALKLLIGEIMEEIANASAFEELRPQATQLSEALKSNQEALTFLMPFALQGNHERFLADATIYMDLLGTLVMAWQWLKMARVAQASRTQGGSSYTDEFLESKVHTMKFFFKYELPKVAAAAATLTSPDELTIVGRKEPIC
jgi:butyryl-CoA dehydrogenase